MSDFTIQSETLIWCGMCVCVCVCVNSLYYSCNNLFLHYLFMTMFRA